MSSSPPSGQSYSSQGNNSRPQQTRNRGANAANHNRRGASYRFDSDGQRTRKKSANTKRPPRWEREGDKLYAEVTKQLDGYNKGNDNDEDACSNHLLALATEQISTVQDVCRLLEPWTATAEELQEAAKKEKRKNEQREKTIAKNNEENQEKQPDKSSPFLWGSLPVGPVLKSRLNASQRSAPTSVQHAAFTILSANQNKGKRDLPTKRTNGIIASPTGTGKTLAYLLPLLCTSPGGQSGEGTGGVLIVTPTIELACQIQREVDVLWPPPPGSSSSCFVVGADELNGSTLQDGEIRNDDENAMEPISPGRITLRSIQHAPLIAGTPKMLRMLYREAERIVNDPYLISKQERITAKSLVTNLRAIVLDEADRLLRTEAVARETAERKQRKLAERQGDQATAAALKKKRLVIARETQTELLLRDLPIRSLEDVQIICASATIGRTMRRQLMQILDAPSADAAATLVTGEEDERVKSKDAERRKSVLLPEKLQHAYRVVVDEEEMSDELLEKDDTMLSTAGERNEEKRVKSTINALWDIMTSIEEAKPIIIFPGRVGVERVQGELMARGLNDVRTLRNLDGKSSSTETTTDIEINTTTDDKNNHHNDWKSVPVYIIGERFARGLDLPDVGYVFLLSPPSSAAGYAHMAGRTGRSGRVGVAVTLVRAKNNEVQRLAAIAEALGLKFDASLSGVAGGGGGEKVGQYDDNSSVVVVQDDAIENPLERQNGYDHLQNVAVSDSSILYPWELLSESALKQKKNAELYEYLVSCGETINKRSTKAELVSAIQLLHSKR